VGSFSLRGTESRLLRHTGSCLAERKFSENGKKKRAMYQRGGGAEKDWEEKGAYMHQGESRQTREEEKTPPVRGRLDILSKRIRKPSKSHRCGEGKAKRPECISENAPTNSLSFSGGDLTERREDESHTKGATPSLFRIGQGGLFGGKGGSYI